MLSQSKQTIRNLVIFDAVSISIGWFGLWLNRMMANEAPGQNLGMLLWLVVPAVTGLLLRAVAGDRWSDAGLRPALKRNLGWYGFALLIYPACIAFILGLGYATGAVSFAGLSSLGIGTFVGLVAAAVLASFVKNIFEELAWRGDLTPRLDSLGWGVGASSVLVDLIWGVWHLPQENTLVIGSSAGRRRRWPGRDQPVTGKGPDTGPRPAIARAAGRSEGSPRRGRCPASGPRFGTAYEAIVVTPAVKPSLAP